MQPSNVSLNRGLTVTGFVFAYLALALALSGPLIGIISSASGDPGIMMVTAFLVIPITAVLAILVGIIAIILSLVLRSKTVGKSKKWRHMLIVAIIGALTLPVLLLAINLL